MTITCSSVHNVTKWSTQWKIYRGISCTTSITQCMFFHILANLKAELTVYNSAQDPDYKQIPCPHFNCCSGVYPDDPNAKELWKEHIKHPWVTQLYEAAPFEFICAEHDMDGNSVPDGMFRSGVSYVAPNRDSMRSHYIKIHGYDDNTADEQTDLHANSADYRNFWCPSCLKYILKPTDEPVDYIFKHYLLHIQE
ncbi:hypothetical protein BDD12DRAFT_1381 [Trichophaea hybrida]|nr:hypothetical protein BDD12DRAFT_1381 [Trichophaea hybrida]